MSDRIERRTFLSGLSYSLGSIFIAPFTGIAKNIKESLQKNNMNFDPVIKTEALGFQWNTQDPFLFCVHHEDYFPNGNAMMGPDHSLLKGRHMGDDFIIKDGFRMYHGQTVPGFPGHPHRGFETVTVVRKGIVDHADSLGAAGRYGNGDVQWMTAGKGVQHSEMFPLLHQDKNNPLELFQIWLNLPSKNKFVAPHFKMLWQDEIPVVEHKDNNGRSTKVEVIAGKLNDKKAPAPPPDSWASVESNEVAIWNIKMEKDARWVLPKASAGIHRTIYFYEGNELFLAGHKMEKYHSATLQPEHDVEIIGGNHESSILLLQGKPIGEPVIQYGPFVMNTKEEINQAFEDYHKDQFGGWPWPRYDQVHERNKTRFAKHADGKLEVKEV